ncbi:MAG: SMC family ATPase [Synergistaceae bacterium]|jgi:exonuclease SbcC|nr:SMC family ATPase [Synergistaceae bacterium]
MKPTKLVLEAFGPFAERQTIDFSRVYDSEGNGIYLISGETGAGKTTIFDAISYALFGESSGGVRDGAMLRSDFVDSAKKTFVRLEFEHRGKAYAIERGGDRPFARMESLSALSPIVDGVRAVTHAVEELLGINRDQFSQIVMIAQGDFQRFLLSGTDGRSEILRRVFGTERFERFQRRLKERAVTCAGVLRDAERSFRQYADGLRCDASSPIALWQNEERSSKEAALSVARADELIASLELALAVDKEALRNGEAALAEAAAEHSGLTLRMAEADRSNKVLDELAAKRGERAKLMAAESEAAEKEKSKRCERGRAALRKVKPIADRLAAITASLASAGDTAAALAIASEKLKAVERAFFMGQASALAEELKPGSPCPVCGSLDHPAPAQRADGVSRAALDKARADAERAAHAEGMRAALARERDAVLGAFQLALTEEGFKSEAEYRAALMTEAEIAAIENELAMRARKIDLIAHDIERLERDAEVIEKNGGRIDTALLASSLAAAEARRSELSRSAASLRSRGEANEALLGRLAETRELLARSEAEYMNVKALSDAANGDVKGRARVAFETYLQAEYFNMVLGAANRRFSDMSDGRYALRRRGGADGIIERQGLKKVGLDLDVFDRYTCKTRDVRSLSGGESFNAALALALGLSDVIQNVSGGAGMEAVFVDEGFGSLDSEALDAAIRTLMDMSGHRTVGVISHVAELGNRIDRKIFVRRTPEGSKIEI